MTNKGLVTLSFKKKKKLSLHLCKASTYDRELHAIYEAIQYFRDILEARGFTVYTDHKPLTTAFQQRPENTNPTQQRRLAFFCEYTTDIRHISGQDNKVAYMFSAFFRFDKD